MILIASTLIGSVPANNIGEDTILYRRNAPAKAPIARSTNPSIPLNVIFESVATYPTIYV